MKTVLVDGCSICQLGCPECPVREMGYDNTIGKGYLTIGNFLKIISANPGINHIEFDNFGELFLNKDLPSILQAACNERIMLSCSGGVNLNTVSLDLLKKIVTTRFQRLTISIDGASQETYSQYRVGGDYDRVIANIAAINDYKQELSTPYPKLDWQFIVFGHNEHELPTARKTAQDLNMRFFPKMNWNPAYSPIRDLDFVRQQTGWDVTTREEYEKKYGVSFTRRTCYQLWDNPRLSWDLTTTGCCWNTWNRFDKFTLDYAKKDLTGLAMLPAIPRPPCRSCEIYKGVLQSGMFLTYPEILFHVVKRRMATDVQYRMWRMNI